MPRSDPAVVNEEPYMDEGNAGASPSTPPGRCRRTRKRSVGVGKAGAQQPDFGACFFVEGLRRLRYEVRHDGNMLHDVAFLASYINDAKVSVDAVRVRRAELCIPMQRDCWEIRRPPDQEMPSVASRLTMSPVQRVEWGIEHAVLSRLMGERGHLWITDLQVVDCPVPLEERPTVFRISGVHFWSLTVWLAPGPWRVALRDLSTPAVPAGPGERSS